MYIQLYQHYYINLNSWCSFGCFVHINESQVPFRLPDRMSWDLYVGQLFQPVPIVHINLLLCWSLCLWGSCKCKIDLKLSYPSTTRSLILLPAAWEHQIAGENEVEPKLSDKKKEKDWYWCIELSNNLWFLGFLGFVDRKKKRTGIDVLNYRTICDSLISWG